jgi:hypothetical protein
VNEQSAWRLAFAQRNLEPYREHPAARIGVLGGSVAQGVADRWSDCDTLVYWDSIDAAWLETPRAAMPAGGGERFTWLESYPGNAWLEQYRFYVAPEKLKRVGAVVGRMELVPPDAPARLEALLDLPWEQVRYELDDLVERTLQLVEEHLPEVDTSRARAVWSLPAEPCEAAPW